MNNVLKSPWSFRLDKKTQQIIPTFKGKDIPNCHGVTITDNIKDAATMEIRVYLGELKD